MNIRKIILIIIFFLIAASSYAENRIASIDVLKLGMTFQQVESAIGKKLEEVPLANFYHYYRPGGTGVSVWFKNNKLVQIKFVYKEKRLEKTETALKVFHEVRKEFTSKWGTPTKYVKHLVVWEDGANIAVLQLKPSIYDTPPELKLVLSSDKSNSEIKAALEGS